MLLFDSWDNCGLQCPLDAICSGDPDQCPTSSALLNVAPCTDLKCQEEVASTTADCQQCLEELEKLCSGTVCSDACFQLPPGPDSCNLCAIADNEHSKGQNACDTAELTHDNIHQQQQHSAFQQPALPSASSASSNSTHLGSLPTLHSCHWDGCQAAFVNKDDLTRHVTRDHLGCPFWSSGHASPAPPPISKNPASPRASSHPTSAPALSPSAALTQPALPDWAQHLSLLPLFDSTSSASSSLATSPWAASTATAQNTPTSWDPASFHTPSTTAASTPDFSLIHAVPSTSQSSATGDGSASSVADVKYHHCQWEDCTEVFDTSAALMAHVSDHLGSGKASYECKWRGCERAHEGRPFSQRQKAIRHLLTHTGDKPFACKFCAKTFSEATALTQVCLGLFLPAAHALYFVS